MRRVAIWCGAAVATIVLVALVLAAIDSVTVRPSSNGHTTAAAEEGVRRNAETRGGVVKEVHCQRSAANVWRCVVRYMDGRQIMAYATWYPAARTLGVSLEQPR